MLFINSLSKLFFSIIFLISFFDLTSFSCSRIALKSFIKVTEPVSNRSKKSRYVSSKSTLNGITQQISHFSQKKNIVEKFIKKNKSIDHSKILNEIDVDYDTLMRILSDLRSEGKVS